MGSLTDKIEGLLVLPVELINPLRALKGAILENEEPIADLNRQQLDRGKNSKGGSLGRYARFSYKGRFQPVDLKLTGDFRDQFTLQVDDKQTEIFSQDWKDEILVKRYGRDIYGVAAPYIANMAEIVRAEFFKRTRQQIFK